MANFLKSLFVKGVEIDTASATAGKVLTYDGTKFAPATPGTGSIALDNLSDVVITSPEEFQTLEYNGTDWVNTYASVVTYVRNAESTTLTTGTCVYLFGATGDHATVKRADHNSDATSAKTVGVVGANITASNNGPVITRGYVDGIDLSTGYTAGDVLWLGESGAFTTTKPTAPDHLVFIGVVVRATNNGIIYVATQNGYELDELHNVSLPSPNSGEFLKYNGSLWVADAIDLGTDTTGNYVGTITAGTGVTTSGASTGEGIAHSISIGQSVSTSATPTFAGGVFTGSSSGDLVRITQTGSGNAFVVEDSANPDSTPFVISNAGSTVIGHTAPVVVTAGVQPNLQILGNTMPTSSSLQVRYNNDTSAPNIYVGHSRSTTIGGHATVVNGDTLGNLQFVGSDGTNFISSASVSGGAEGTISTGVVPGRLIFNTANSAGTLTERMRINSDGNVGVGTTPIAGYSFFLAKPITGLTTSYGFVAGGTVQSDVTNAANQFITGGNTAAAAFTLNNYNHFYANGVSTPGTGSTITNQTGFLVSSTTTGATNNYGFRGDIPSGTGRYNLYMSGTAQNYLAGRLGVGATLTSGAMAQITNTTAADKAFVVKGAASQSGDFIDVQTSGGFSVFKVNNTGAGWFRQEANGLQTNLDLGRMDNALSTPLYRIQTDDTNGDILRFYSSRWSSTVKFARGSSGGDKDMVWITGGDGGNQIQLFNTSNSVNTLINGNGATYFNGGNVGIGTASPTANLNVYSSSNTNVLFDSGYSINLILNRAGTGNYNSIRLNTAGTTRWAYGLQNDATDNFFIGSGATAYDSATAPKFVIQPGGNVGIGTTTPSYPLHISRGTGSVEDIAMAVDVAGGNAGDSAGYVMRAANTNELGAIRSYVESSYLSNMRFYTAGATNVLTERMRINSSGNVGIGGTPSALSSLTINKPLTGGIVSYGISASQAIQSDVTNTAIVYASNPATVAQAFTLGNLSHFRVYGVDTPGAGSTVTTQVGYFVDSSLTGAGTSNYAFRGSVPASVSASTNYNLFMDGTAQNYLRGRLGIGTSTGGSMFRVLNDTTGNNTATLRNVATQTGSSLLILDSSNAQIFNIDSSGNTTIGNTPLVGRSFLVNKPVTGALSSYGIAAGGTVQSDVTSTASQFLSAGNTANAAFTIGSYNHFYAFGVTTPGAGSTITTQNGFLVSSSTTGAANNFAFRGLIPTGANNNYNIYMDGTAPNYMLGRLGVGATLTSGATTQITNPNASPADKVLVVKGAESQSGNLQDWQDSSGNVLASVSSAGAFSAVTKSFDIPHPTKPNMRLLYGSVEAPEHSVQIRGRCQGDVILLPDYWSGLVDESSITVQLTPVGKFQSLFVESVSLEQIVVGGRDKLDFFFVVAAERVDIPKLVVEYGS